MEASPKPSHLNAYLPDFHTNPVPLAANAVLIPAAEWIAKHTYNENVGTESAQVIEFQ